MIADNRKSLKTDNSVRNVLVIDANVAENAKLITSNVVFEPLQTIDLART